MLCRSADGTSRGSPAAALGPHPQPAFPVHPQHRDGERERSVSNTAVFEQGLGHPDPSHGPAWSRIVLKPAGIGGANGQGCPGSPPRWRGGVQMDLILSLYCPKAPGSCTARVLGQGWQPWDRPPAPNPRLIPSSSSSLTLCALVAAPSRYYSTHSPPQKGEGRHLPPSRPLSKKGFEIVKKCVNPICIQWGLWRRSSGRNEEASGAPFVLGEGTGDFLPPRFELGGGWQGWVCRRGDAQPPTAHRAVRQLISLCQPREAGILMAFRKRSCYF